ncbi:hypothetical protein LY13_004003 [Prauserella aidingensis]|uniref:hypothetical protein n=1 Tax=Prauserella aidingensis TaxID=387890 RepID=UPI0020A44461|nr:hypothetical protein [Prauserella aidingensis]MCP2255229.1 hypothetical protein [Prauserella aidingensis]
MSWAELREQKRADRQAEAEQRRLDADAEADRRLRVEQARAEQERREAEQVAEQHRQLKAERRARRAAVSAWVRGHVVDVLIYPAVLVAFAMAGPSMAAYGAQVYGSPLGWLLPGISELLMLAFAVAVLIARRREPDRPVLWLQAGVWVFAALSAGLNFLHGLDRGWTSGAVMALVAVSGIAAHQLTLATPPRSAAERAEARIARRAARKVARVRKAAVRQAVAELDADGTARLVYAPGRYVLTARGRRLESAIDPTPAAEAAGVPAGDPAWDVALADLIAEAENTGPGEGESAPESGGGVATLDIADDQHESSPDRGPIRPRVGRTLDQLRAEFAAAIEAGEVDPSSAESIRKALRCAPKYARQLRDEHTGGDA